MCRHTGEHRLKTLLQSEVDDSSIGVTENELKRQAWFPDGRRHKACFLRCIEMSFPSPYISLRPLESGQKALKKCGPINKRDVQRWLTRDVALCSALKRDHLHVSVSWVSRWELFQRNAVTHQQNEGEPPRLASRKSHIISYHLWSISSGLGSLPSTLSAWPHSFLSRTRKTCANFVLILLIRKLRLEEFI